MTTAFGLMDPTSLPKLKGQVPSFVAALLAVVALHCVLCTLCCMCVRVRACVCVQRLTDGGWERERGR